MKIVFDVKELSMMFDQFTKGIETICFKPAVCDPMYHVESPKFLTYKDTASESKFRLIIKCLLKSAIENLYVYFFRGERVLCRFTN